MISANSEPVTNRSISYQQRKIQQDSPSPYNHSHSTSYTKPIYENDAQTPVHNSSKNLYNNVEAPLNSNRVQQSYPSQNTQPTSYNTSISYKKSPSVQNNLTPSSAQNLNYQKQHSASLDKSSQRKLVGNVFSPQNYDNYENSQISSNQKERDKSANIFSPSQYSKNLDMKTYTNNSYVENASPLKRKGNE